MALLNNAINRFLRINVKIISATLGIELMSLAPTA